MQEDGCPICRTIADSDDRYFFWFFVEQYGELHTIDALTRSLGFCWSHATQLSRRSGGGHQLSAVHAMLARRVRARLHDRGPKRGERDAAPVHRDPCPVCRDRQEAARREAFWLAGLLENRPAAERYGHPGLLCFPHLQSVAVRVSGAALDRLLLSHKSAMTAVLKALAELRVELDRIAPDGRQDLHKAVQPALHLAVGHERENASLPARTGRGAGRPPRDPVREVVEWIHDVEACPVCLEVHRAWLEWVAWLDEAVLRDRALEHVLPTCPDHVWPVRAGGAYLLVAATEAAVKRALGEVLTGLRVLHPLPSKDPERWGQRLKRRLLGPRQRLAAAREMVGRPLPCPVCRRLALAVDGTLALMFALLEDRHHRAAFERGHGLCLKHCARALVLEPSTAIRESLAEVEAARLAQLEWELKECLRKGAWDYRPEAKGTVQTAWRRALARLSGSPPAAANPTAATDPGARTAGGEGRTP